MCIFLIDIYFKGKMKWIEDKFRVIIFFFLYLKLVILFWFIVILDRIFYVFKIVFYFLFDCRIWVF